MSIKKTCLVAGFLFLLFGSVSALDTTVGKYRLVINEANGKTDIYCNGTQIVKESVCSFKNNSTTYYQNDLSNRSITQSKLVDDFGIGKKIVITAETSGITVKHNYYLYENLDYMLTDFTIESSSNLMSNYMAPVWSNAAITFLPSGTNVNRFLYVPFDNDRYATYGSSNFATTTATSCEVNAFYNETDRNGLVIGSIEHDHWKTGVKTGLSGSNQISSFDVYGGYRTIHDKKDHGSLRGNKIKSPKIFIGYFTDWRTGMETFGDANAIFAPKASYMGSKPFGWNSFGVIKESLTAAKAETVAAYIKSGLTDFSSSANPVYIGLDAGWSDRMNNGIGMAQWISNCKGRGQKVGVYSNPFCHWGGPDHNWCLCYSWEGCLEAMPAVLCLKAGGAYFKCYDNGWPMDPTHPDVKQSIRMGMASAKSMGIEYMKVDFLSHAAMEADSYYDPNVHTGMEAYNHGMKFLYECAREYNIYLNQSISPLFPACYAQSRRICCDAHASASHTKYALNSLSYGWWLDHAYHYNDADHVVLQSQTAATVNRSRITSSIITGIFILGDDYSVTTTGTNDPRNASRIANLTNAEINRIARQCKAFRPVNSGANYAGAGDNNSAQGSAAVAATQFYAKVADTTYVAVFNYGASGASQTVDFDRIGGIPVGNNTVKELWGNTTTNSTAARSVSTGSISGSGAQLYKIFPVTPTPATPAMQFPAFTDVTSPIGVSIYDGLIRGDAIWGDVDNDGYPEAILFSTHYDQWGYRHHFIENNNGTLSRASYADMGLADFTNDCWDWTFTWIDYNNDGWIDLLMTGRQGSSTGLAQLYKNNGASVDGTTVKRFSLVSGTGITGLCYSGEEGISMMSKIAVGDYDNDGYPDFVMVGRLTNSGDNWQTHLYRNNGGNGTFTLQTVPVNGTTNFTPLKQSAVVMTDFNNDGWLDIIINGWRVGGGPADVKIYKNNGNGFFSEWLDLCSAFRYAAGEGDIGVGDLNGDGRMDVFLTGNAYDANRIQGYEDWPGNTAAFCLSTSTGFHLFAQGLSTGITPDNDPKHITRLKHSAVELIDLNADGRLDIAVSGNWWDSHPETSIYLNNGLHPVNNGSIQYEKSTSTGLKESYDGVLAFEDYDKDGYMDAMMLGNYSGFRIFRNNGNLTKNTRPSAPSNLDASYANGQWTFTWDRGSDAETPEKSLRYNIYVKLPGTDEIFMIIPADLTTGYLRHSRLHAALNTVSYTMTLPFTKFEWGVQTIDQGKLSSPFAVAETCSIPYIVDDAFKTWTEYATEYGGDIIFRDGGQLSGIVGNKTVNGVVKVEKTFVAKQWYPIGFPFDIASVRSNKPTYDNYDLKTYNPGGASGDKGDYWLRTYDGVGDVFEEYTYGATSIIPGGYAIQLPANLDGATLTFTSHPYVTLTNSDVFNFLAGKYKLTNNPSVANTMITNGGTNYYYTFEYTTQTGNFGLIAAPYPLKPFEPVVIANAIVGPLRASMNVDQLTPMPTFDVNDKIVTEYYNLQGIRVMQPQRGQVYIAKSVHESGKTQVVKLIWK